VPAQIEPELRAVSTDGILRHVPWRKTPVTIIVLVVVMLTDFREWDGPAVLPPPTALRVGGGFEGHEGHEQCPGRRALWPPAPLASIQANFSVDQFGKSINT
jgi:hypothetical protein